ncbi:MAG: hypothetical protein PHS92_00640 [Candidatus Gracilibacteria bacterium]|nr:hypothetical protein [Candidatus Gracilibacteria bacterium]
MKDFKKNKVIILLLIAYNFVLSVILSAILFIEHIFKKSVKPINENKFLDIMNFIFHIGPKSFWKNPTGIKIGRSLGTFIHYVFYMEEAFKETRKK